MNDENFKKYAEKYAENLLQRYGIKHPNKSQIDYCLKIIEEYVFDKIEFIKFLEDW